MLCKEQYAKELDKHLFPGIQGGPLMHVVAGKAVCFGEALKPEFKEYAKQVVTNCKVLSDTLQEEGFRIVSGGTDNHLILVDVMSMGVTGKEAEKLLDEVCITCNKNSIPFDTQKPFVTSGIRLGSAAMTTRGFKEEEFKQLGLWISRTIKNKDNPEELEKIREEVLNCTKNYPIRY